MNNTPTPETDTERYYHSGNMEAVDADFARKLERERDAYKGREGHWENEFSKLIAERDQLLVQLAEAKKQSPEYEVVQEIIQLRKVADDLAGQIMQAKNGFGIYNDSPSMDEALRSYNFLPHVIERNKTK